MTRWWLIPAILVGALIWAALFAAAFAEQTYRWTEQNYVAIQTTSRPGVVAEVVFANENIHPLAAEDFDLTLDGLTVSVRVDRGLGLLPDTMTITPPAGYVAYPPEVTVPEGGAGTILILLEVVS